MIPWEHLAAAQVPGGGGELRLMRRGAEYSIMLGTNELMNSRLSGSEEALATLACARLGELPAARLLVGGLGMGFTLRAALAKLGPAARITVAELSPDIIAWARDPMAHIFAGSLDDPRVVICEADVGELIAAVPAAYNAILLDVDNGPDGLSRPTNHRLYTRAGLAQARAALSVGGVLAVWSSAPDAGFTRRLRDAGFSVEEVAVRARAGKGARHVIWLGTSPKKV